MFDNSGGLWIKLTVCGMTRIGFGDAPKKIGGDATKECIGDAIRNAAMRFGAALDLWHKGELHVYDDTPLPHPNSKEAKEIKDKHRESHPSYLTISGYLADESQYDFAKEALLELETEDEKQELWRLFTTKEKEIVRELKVL
jgi:hypothetical protein